MSDLDKRVRTAFDAVSAPDALVERTLAAVESERRKGQEANARSDRVLAAGKSKKHEGKARVDGAVRLAAMRHKRIRMVAAASLAAVLVCSGASVVYASESAYVEVSGDSTVELAVNRLGIVVRGSSHDPETQACLDGAGIVGKSYEEAVSTLIEQGVVSGENGETPVEFLVTCSNDGQCERLEEATAQCLDESGIENGSCSQASEEERAEALANGLGVSKYRAYESLKALGSDITLEECRAMSMRDLRDALDECGGEEGQSEGSASSGQGGNAQHGQGQGEHGASMNGGASGTAGGEGAGSSGGSGHGQGAGRSDYAGQGNGGGRP